MGDFTSQIAFGYPHGFS